VEEKEEEASIFKIIKKTVKKKERKKLLIDHLDRKLLNYKLNTFLAIKT